VLQPFAFTTLFVEEATAEAIPDRLPDYRQNFHAVSPVLGGRSSFGNINLSGDESKLEGK
jgi:hypothetical protein